MLKRRDLDPASLLPPFKSSLPVKLRRFGERTLRRNHALTRGTYSTRRFLSGSPCHAGAVLTTQFAGGKWLVCEGESPELVRFCLEHDISLANNTDTNRAMDLIDSAIAEVIEPYPFLRSAISELAWRCHILHAQSGDYDTSFSDPGIPFSIFLSVPPHGVRRSILRVAESLIHETMHLQLTLFEAQCPLVDTASTWSMYSPWKRQQRQTQGVLHGLYVFCVLRWVWHEISRSSQNATDRQFALLRVSEIDEETDSVRPIEGSPALTSYGKQLLQQLFAAEEQAKFLS
jgi:HEXXH motif-containing protein